MKGAERFRIGDYDCWTLADGEFTYPGWTTPSKMVLGRQRGPSRVGQFAVGQSPAVIIADAESLSAFHELLPAGAAYYSMLSK